MSDSTDLKKYENVTYASMIKDGSLKSVISPMRLEGLLSFDKLQSQFQKISSKLPLVPTYTTFSGMLSRKSLIAPSLVDEDPARKDIKAQINKINLFGNFLSIDPKKLLYIDAVTVGNTIFLPPSKMDLSSDRGKALIVHEMTHLVQNEREPRTSADVQEFPSSKYAEMEREAQDAEREFLRLSMQSKLNKGRKFSFNENFYPNNAMTRLGGIENKTENEGLDIQKMTRKPSLVHPDIAKIFKQVMKEDISNLIPKGSQTPSNNTNYGISLSNPVEQSSTSTSTSTSTAKKSKTERVFLASEGRSVYPPATVPFQNQSSNAAPSSDQISELLDLNSLAEKVYDLMARRLVMERSRRGMR